MESWPFSDPPNVAVITVRQIIDDAMPILRVFHDADDGCWQFHTDANATTEDALVILLKNMIERDPSLAELADLPCGWMAWRETASDAWQRAENR